VELQTPDGRSLELVVAGPAEGTPLVLHHGTPGAAVVFDRSVDAAARHGLRTVVYARPGYGRSTPRPGRSVADAAADVTVVLDALGAAEFVTVGWSGGGPHALAAAALLPDRCRGVATIAGVAPYGAQGLDWLAGMGAENVAEFGAALAGEQPLSDYLEKEAAGLAGVRPRAVAAALGDLVSDVDRAAITGDFAEYLAASFRTSVSTGIAGWRDDDLAFAKDWGFALDAVTVPVTIWQGDQDRMVPYDHGRWLAGHVSGARVRLLAGEGHLTLGITRFDEVLAELR
jgi:pimeloyl-ACP methyl ester carboxylesterase